MDAKNRGTDLRREPIQTRKATLTSILRKAHNGVRLNDHLAHPDGIGVSARLPDGAGRHRLKTSRFALPIKTFAGLAQV